MQENYTQSAAAVKRLAKRAAKSGGHGYIGSEHLLVGLIREEKGTAGALLRAHHAEYQKVSELIDTLVAVEDEASGLDGSEWSPRAGSILSDAAFLAQLLGSEAIGQSISCSPFCAIRSVWQRVCCTRWE